MQAWLRPELVPIVEVEEMLPPRGHRITNRKPPPRDTLTLRSHDREERPTARPMVA